MGKDLAKFFVPTERTDSQGKKVFSLDREAFRANPAFSWAYAGVGNEDYGEIYRRLYGSYEKATQLIQTEPPMMSPQDFKRKVNDKDVQEMETCLAMMYTFGLNVIAASIDASAGRPFIPRDPTTDGSYETALRNHNKS